MTDKKKTTKEKPEPSDDESEKEAEPMPSVQSEAGHASQAAEDIRDGQVAEPNS